MGRDWRSSSDPGSADTDTLGSVWTMLEDQTEDNTQDISVTEKVEGLKREVKEKESIVEKLESEYEIMNETIGSHLRHKDAQAGETEGRKVSRSEVKNEKDSLVFHGVQVDDMELMSRDEDIKKNFLDHNIKKLLKTEWDIDCSRPFKHVFRSESESVKYLN